MLRAPLRRVLAAPLALAAALVACDTKPAGPPPLRLVDVEPGPNDGLTLVEEVGAGQERELELLFLNSDIELTFDAPLDALSVSSRSATVVGTDGRAAAGRWIVEGRRLTFSPAEVLARDLRDGGYRPGEEVVVTVRGYPSPAALRSTDGRWLPRSVELHYRVVAVGPDAPIAFPFLDASPSADDSKVLQTLGPTPGVAPAILPGAPLVLRCAQPVDPGTMVDDEYRAVPVDGVGDEVAVRLELQRNWDESDPGSPNARALLAVHFARPLSSGYWYLEPRGARPSIADFNNNPVWPRRARFLVEVDAERVQSELRLDFLDDDEALPIAVEGADGTAHWDSDGRVTLRYPAAAGDGGAGDVRLGSAPPGRDVQATHLRLEPGVTCELPEGGLVVLRSQGRLQLSGRLVRRATGSPSPMFVRRFSELGVSRERLSDWLARAREQQPNWTVLIAGGDLVLDGEIDVGTPLLIVAGGWVRGRALPRAADGQLWMLGEGGFAPTSQGATPARAADLVMDAPLDNPLRVPLTFAIVSSPLPKNAVPAGWSAPDVRAADRAGTARVRFAPDELPPGAVITEEALRSSPRAFGPVPVRAVIELSVPAAPADGVAPWDPPFVDEVRLGWTPR